MNNNEQEQIKPELYVLVAEDKETGSRRNISIYRTVKDAEVICEAHENNSFPDGEGLELNENEVLGIEPVSRENTFGMGMPSWKEDMKRITEQLETLMADMREGDEETTSEVNSE